MTMTMTTTVIPHIQREQAVDWESVTFVSTQIQNRPMY
jgi:hypothetical protein